MSLELDATICERARVARDARFDGRFFVGVRTTGVYCRPVCPVRPSHAQNVSFYPSAAAAAVAGFRPCLRCRPESAPGVPAWRGSEVTVARALRLIDEGALDESGVDELSARLGIGPRQLSRLFETHLGASPIRVAQTRRVHFAKKLIDETDLSMTGVALASGFKSVRRFNELLRAVYGRSPSTLRRRRAASGLERALRLRLAYRPPLDWDSLREHLARHAIPGIEQVDRDSYARNFVLARRIGRLVVRPLTSLSQLELEVVFPDLSQLPTIVARVRRAFDLDAEPCTIARDLRQDGRLAPLVRARAGLRVPGPWEGFETAVRVLVEQGRPAARARRTLHSIAARLTGADDPLVFPAPSALSGADLGGLGLGSLTVRAVRRLGRAVEARAIDLETPRRWDDLALELRRVLGVTESCATSLATAIAGDPDAFASRDRRLVKRAERWRPWRAYAAMHLAMARSHRATDRS